MTATILGLLALLLVGLVLAFSRDGRAARRGGKIDPDRYVRLKCRESRGLLSRSRS